MPLIAELIYNGPTNGARLQLLSMSGSEGLSRPFEYQVEILCDKADLDLATFLGKSMTVAVTQPVGGTRYFNGLVARFVQSGRKTRHYYHYQATLRPWFWFLSRTQDCKIFQEKSVVQIVQDVFGDHTSLAKYKKSLTASYSNWVYCVQYRESDMNFVARMLEQEGIYYYFEHTQTGHEMVLCDGASAHSAVPNYKEIPYVTNWEEREDMTECISSWGSSVQALPTKTVLADFDFERPSTALRKEHSVSRSHDLASFEVFDYPGEYTLDADGQAYAKSRAQEQQAGFQLVTGHSDARGLACGHTFKATGMTNKANNKEYLVISTNIFVEEGVQTGNQDSGSAQYSCDFQVMPTSDVFRAPRVTPKPTVHGPQTAMVVGPSGEHIFTDKYGRVKVQFHWDRVGQKNDKSSCWMRVSQPWAGKGFGAIAIPRIGDEVVVSFLEGDPDQPIITGRVYNAEFVPPYDLPAKKHFSGLLTRSVGSQARAEANEFRFSDEPGKEYLWLQAQKDFHREVENDDHDTVKNDQYITVKGKREETIEKELSQTVDKSVSIAYGMDYHHDVTADAIHKIGANYDVDVGGEYAFKVTGKGGIDIGKALDLNVGDNFAMSSDKDVTIKGMNIVIEAGMQLTLKAGSNTIVLGSKGISIDGLPFVNINCGGGGGSAQKASPKAPVAAKKAAKAKIKPDPN